MKKHELIQALQPFDDETDLVIWLQGVGELDLIRTAYQAMTNEKPAFVHLIARSASTVGGERV